MSTLFGLDQADEETEEEFDDVGPPETVKTPTSVSNPDLWCQLVGTPSTEGAAACMGSATVTEPQVRSDVSCRKHVPLSSAMDTFALHGGNSVPCF